MTSITLIFRPSSCPERTQGSLALRIIHQRRSKTITLKDCSIYSKEWNVAEQMFIYPENDSQRSMYLESVENRVNNEMNLLRSFIFFKEKQGRYTVDEIVNLYRLRKEEGKLLGFTEMLAKEKENNGKKRTARAYRTVSSGLIKYNKGQDIPLSQINKRLIEDFEEYLKKEGKMQNTISYYMRNLRFIYNRAAADRYIRKKDNLFERVYTGIMKTSKRALLLEDMQSINEIDFNTLLEKERQGSKKYEQLKELETARCYFLFSFFACGMCFIDLSLLTKQNINGNILHYARKKTGLQIEIRVNAKMREIIDYFSNETQHSPYLFPILKHNGKDLYLQYNTALRAQNQRLKKIAALANVKKPLSTHVARHTWATIAKKNNIGLRIISECLGHASERTTQIYMDSLEISQLEEASELIASTIFRPRTVEQHSQQATYI